MDIEEAREMMKMVDTTMGKMSMEDSNTIWCVLNKLHCSEATIKYLRGELTKVPRPPLPAQLAGMRRSSTRPCPHCAPPVYTHCVATPAPRPKSSGLLAWAHGDDADANGVCVGVQHGYTDPPTPDAAVAEAKAEAEASAAEVKALTEARFAADAAAAAVRTRCAKMGLVRGVASACVSRVMISQTSRAR
jgi:hypothetical protein